ncbi:hypothetical protein [Salibacterium lacus]|uniref:Uncharacterized protein n=1 Tax=Salibacterium lacus TaxID=1898109 RepID=A0ABW5SY74_9BACI
MVTSGEGRREAGEVSGLKPWAVYDFPWGSAVAHRKGGYTQAFLANGSEINFEGYAVELHDNGIELYPINNEEGD